MPTNFNIQAVITREKKEMQAGERIDNSFISFNLSTCGGVNTAQKVILNKGYCCQIMFESNLEASRL